jgi:hypothetical protein
MNQVELDYFGKQAAKEYLEKDISLNDSIVKIAQSYEMNRDQVERIVENANTQTYLALFNKSDDKYVKFPVAETEKVAEALDTPLSPADNAQSDYAEPPKKDLPEIEIFPVSDIEKEAASNEYTAEKLKLYQQVQYADQHFMEKIGQSDYKFFEEATRLYKAVKQEVLGGEKFGYIKQAMLEKHPINLTTVILDEIKQQLAEEDRLLDLNDLEKTAELFDPDSRILAQLDKVVKTAEEALNWREKYAGFGAILGGAGAKILKGLGATAKSMAKHPGKWLLGAAGVGAVGTAYKVGKKAGQVENTALKDIPERYRK